ncbi:MAG: SpoIIE family protein phosphatase [Planctomycetaceae bacterium]|nr:SpoIIE family protein phosphatase [Planctomycetaceae bacterium]
MTSQQNSNFDELEEQIILAREIGRGIAPPEFPGFRVALSGHRVNLWWQDRRQRSRDYSDAFISSQNKLVLTTALVSDSLDATGLALSIRAFLRGCLSGNSTISQVVTGIETWSEADPQWSGFCQLGIAVVQSNHSLEFAGFGHVCFALQNAPSQSEEIKVSPTIPLGMGAYVNGMPIETHNHVLQNEQTFKMWIPDCDSVSEYGTPFPGPIAAVTANGF